LNPVPIIKDTTIELLEAHEQHWVSYWKGLSETSWGSYVTQAERVAIEMAHGLAGESTVALDIGCGRGQWSRLLSDLGWHIVCTELDQRNLAFCKALVPSATCILVAPDERRLPCEAGSVGLALCIEVSPVIQTDWFVDEVARVLKPGGYVVGVLLNRRSWRGLVRKSAIMNGEKFTWYRFAYPAWKKRLYEGGFTVAYEEGCCWFPFRRTSDSPLVPLAVRIERSLGLRKLISLSPYVIFVARKGGAAEI
jgi:SAM-dependent methyltransferase